MNLKKYILVPVVMASSSFLSLIATMQVNVASAWFVHQPEVPEELRKKK
ncbi:cyclic lactone autoinducer peptide [Brevibacillus porteri]|nr:cyclic lactone autoinducer peptide [Brevibacillus porteri]MED1800641.1 cyclic lactone autoinducer peptide [Brevibacillus porteri]MED2134731.1 cyclic lactone autoinducer peptide [Brevibacillus porteri]MED2745612.1 cyclic lactone autoinducer peptide [Brevibacillus porteri]MED2814750.1 cyclic lactone autoinducer peptide [Brevibacillus porteri]MED2896324.1 cyclic lactone autoinducer peptide [Brevibacillus porteri]